MKPLPIGIQTFEKIVNKNMVYVDKTELIYELAQKDYLFLSRPRRFGKSLLISTLQAYFEGRKDLFKGLKIEQLETDWTEYPVVNLSFAKCKSKQLDVIVKFVSIALSELEVQFGIIDKAEQPDDNKQPNINLEDDIGFENDIFRRAVVTAVKEDNPEILLQHLKDFLCKIPYPNAAETPEWYYQNLLYAILATCGLNVQTEIRTSSGRIDFVVISPKTIFLFEFKLNKSAEEALRQIDEKEYEKKFSFEGKHVWKIGVNFSSEKRTVDEWKIVDCVP